ncbi:MAG: FkbM family methyltransferase [Gammaproteobacteria bacterium]|nr:FkbM family methyltransferase [Gammaproteobacteria bacterium]
MLRKIMNYFLWLLPMSMKYGKYSFGMLWRNYRLPYKEIRDGWVIVQLGAPWDLLKAGRSRSIHFSKRVGEGGRVIVIEPDAKNVKELNNFISSYNINNITVIPKGAWSKKTKLRFLIDDEHPASNLIEDVYDSSRTDMSKYRVEEIEVDSVENILKENGIERVNLLSITTNGAESEILEGARNVSSNIELISIVGNPSTYSVISEIGFELNAEDDRGYIYVQKNSQVSA